MVAISQSSVHNRLIAALDPGDYERIAPHFERVSLDAGEVIVRANTRAEWIYFPEQVMVAVVACVGGHHPVEIGVVSAEGMSSLPVLFGCDHSPHDEIVEMRAGSALRIARERFVEACMASQRANALFLRSAFAFSIQVGRTLVVHVKYNFERRLARWLLMRQDRLDGDDIEVTHDYIAAMLGVRRSTVTQTMHMLEGERAVRNVPGQIFIRDRAALEAIAGDAYGGAERELHRLVGSFPAQSREAPRGAPQPPTAEPLAMPALVENLVAA